MTNATSNQNAATGTETAAEAVAVVRTHPIVMQELKNAVGKLARQEAKAVESSNLAATFNADIIDMATGKVAQTATRSIMTVSSEQSKHVKRACKIRETNIELAGTIGDLRVELGGMLDELLLPYAPAPEVEVDAAGTDAALAGNDSEGYDPEDQDVDQDVDAK